MNTSCEEIVAGSLLYHAVHGVCRVQKVVKERRSEKISQYIIVPNDTPLNKVLFTVAGDSLEVSGFHPLVSLESAKSILEYFKAGEGRAHASETFASEDAPTWALAKEFLNCCRNENAAKDQRRRQTLERSVRGLTRELAFVFKISLADVVAQVRKNLERTAKINPVMLNCLAQVVED